MASVTILGAGSWGTALAVHLARLGRDVRLWARNAELAASLESARENAVYLPGVPLPATLHATSDLHEAATDSAMVVFVSPSSTVRGLAEAVRPHLDPDAVLVTAAKGVEQDTRLTMSAVLDDVLGHHHRARVAALSGPSFARGVGHGVPTAVTAAARDVTIAEAVQETFNGQTFRVYTSTDVIGVEIGGAVKNVIAVAAGVSDGLGFGHNSRAALITRGLAEITRLAVRLGADRQTLAGLSGLGDLVLTCTGSLSRNRHVGIELARGRHLNEILASMKMIAEGVNTTSAALALGARHGVELPIATQMAAVLEGRSDVRTAVEALMLRPQRHEAETIG